MKQIVPGLFILVLASCSKDINAPSELRNSDAQLRDVAHMPVKLGRALEMQPSIKILMFAMPDSAQAKDSVTFIFSDTYTTGLDSADVRYSVKFYDDFATKAGSYLLSVDARPLPLTYFVSDFKTWNYTAPIEDNVNHYRLLFIPQNIPSGFRGLLMDSDYETETETITKYSRVYMAKPTVYDYVNHYNPVYHFTPPPHRFKFGMYNQN